MTRLFTNMNAWFSPSCNQDVIKKWENEGGKVVEDVNDAMFFFSDDPKCVKTINIYKNEPSIVVFQSKWINQAILCSINGVLSTHKIETLMLVPTVLKKETTVTRNKKEYKEFIEKQVKEQNKEWEIYKEHVDKKCPKGRKSKTSERTTRSQEKTSNNDEIEQDNIEDKENIPSTSIKTADKDEKLGENSNHCTEKLGENSKRKGDSEAKKIIKTKTKRRSNMNLSESSSDDISNDTNKNSKKKLVKTTKPRRSRRKQVLETESEEDTSEEEIISHITPRVNRAHRSAEKYNKKYIEPETDDSDTESENSDNASDSESNNNDSHKQISKKKKVIKTKSSENSNDNKSAAVNQKHQSVVESKNKTNGGSNNQNKINRLENQTNNNRRENNKDNIQELICEESSLPSDNEYENKTTKQSKGKQVNGEEDSDTQDDSSKQLKTYSKRSRKLVVRDNCIGDKDISKILETNEEAERYNVLSGSNKKRKLYNGSNSKLSLKEPILCLEKTPVTINKPSHKERLSPNEIHNMLNGVASPQVLLSGNVRSSEKKRNFSSDNNVGSSPELVPTTKATAITSSPELILTTKATVSSSSTTNVMKAHTEMINHKKAGEKSTSNFTFGSFSGYSHINDFEIPDVSIEDFVVNENGCRVKLCDKK